MTRLHSHAAISAHLCECGCGTFTKLAPWSTVAKGWTKGQPLRFVRGHATKGRPRDRVPLEERFWNFINKDGPLPLACPERGPCWIWRGSTTKDYGMLKGTAYNNMLAHRVSWMLHNGPIPDGLDICHYCDNPTCINPHHLFIGTHKDNMMDMASKGRARNQYTRNAYG